MMHHRLAIGIQQAQRNVGDALYFIASDSSQAGLWRTDGTPAGTAFLRQDSAATPAQGGQTNTPITALKGEVFYSTDGGIVAFDPLNTAPGYTGAVVSTLATVTKPTHLTAIGDDLYFLVSEPGTFDPMTGTFVGGGDTVFVYNHLTQTTAQVFSTNQLNTENARIHSIAEVDGSCVIGAGVSGNYTVGTTGTGEFWSVSRNPEVAIIHSSLLENAPPGTVAGQLVSLGITSDTPVTYSLVSGQGDNNNNVFSIDGDSLKTSGLFDYELTPTLNIRVRATTANGTYAENALVIQVGDLNESPIALDLAGHSISENVAPGTTIGFYSTSDPDVGETFTYSFTSGTGDTDNNVFSINGDQLQTKDALDHEAKDSYTIRVQSSDSAGNTIEGTFVINVLDENDGPTGIQLSSASTQEGVPVGTEIGVFSTTDADLNDSHVYQLVSGEGDEENLLFAIDGNKLVTNDSIEFEAGAIRSIRVRSFDLGQSSVDSIFQITVTDVANPLSFDVLADTNDSTPIITGTGVPDEIVYLSADFDNSGTAETMLGIALVGSGGAWAIASTIPLPEGTIALSAYATESVGNRSDEISSTITTDYTAPNPPYFTALAPTNDQTPVIQGTGEVGATVQLWADLEARGTATVPVGTSVVASDGTWSIISTAPLPEGTVSLLATQTDPVGNESGPNLDAIVIDLTPPPAPSFDAESLTAENTLRPTLTGTGEVPSTLFVLFDSNDDGVPDASFGTTTVDIDGSWSLTATTDVPVGSVVISATQTDWAGNTSTSTQATLIVESSDAQTFDFDFEDGVPNQSTAYGTATIVNGKGASNSAGMVLTPMQQSTSGSWVLDDLTPGRTLEAFTISYKQRMGPAGYSTTDGISLSIGSDLPADAGSYGESGAGSDLRISFDAYHGSPGKRIDITYQGDLVARSMTNPFTNGVFVDVEIEVTPEGVLSLSYNNSQIFTDVQIPNFKIANAQFGFGARNGAEHAEQAIDDITLTVVTSVTENPALPPDTPINFQVQTPSGGAAIIYWDAPLVDGGSAVTSYILNYRATNEEWVAVELDATSPNMGYTALGLPGVQHDFRVAAINSAGQGPWSATLHATPAIALSEPINLQVQTPEDGRAIIYWDAPLADGGAVVTSYVLNYRVGNGEWITIPVDATSPNMGYTAPGLSGVPHDFRVAAINSIGQGPWSTTVRATPAQTPSTFIEGHRYSLAGIGNIRDFDGTTVASHQTSGKWHCSCCIP